MKTISREELKQKLERKEDFRLVMALAEWAYQAKHIPGSIHFATMREALQSLNKEDEIVVYCSDENCIASTALGQLLERNGYSHVLHFAGGLADWEQAGYPLEGDWVNEGDWSRRMRVDDTMETSETEDDSQCYPEPQRRVGN